MSKKMLRTTVTVAATAALLATSAVPAFAAEVKANIPEELQTACEKTFVADDVVNAFADLGTVFADKQLGVDIKAEMPSEDASQPAQFSLEASYAQNLDTTEQSLKGNAAVSGINIGFQENLDATRLVLSCPMLLGEKGLSYDYTNDAPTGALADYADMIAQVNAYIREIRDTLTSGAMSPSEAYQQAIIDAAGEITFTDGGSKDVTVGENTVSCTGYAMSVSQDQLKNVYTAMMETPLSEGGKSITDMLLAVDAFASSVGESSMADALTEAQSVFDEIESLDYVYYVGDGLVRALDCTVNGQAITMTFTGEDIPWHEVTMTSEGETMMSMSTVVEGTQTTYSFAVSDGSALTCSYDTATGAFALGDGTSTVFDGTFGKTDTGYAFHTEVEGVVVDLAFNTGATVTPFEGETLEVTSASMEELAPILNTVSSMFGGSGE